MKFKKKIKSSIVLSMVTITLAATVGCANNSEGGYENLDGTSAEKIILEDHSILVLDVRTPEEYAEGHIKNGVNIPVDELENRLDEISQYKDKDVFVYCKSGGRSEEASKILAKNGFKKINNMEDGVSEYDYELLNYTNITGEALKKYASEHPEAIVLDVRDEKDYRAGHIENAINIPLGELQGRLGELDKNKDILVYCFVGGRSAEASKILSKNGFEHIYNSIEGVKEFDFNLVK